MRKSSKLILVAGAIAALAVPSAAMAAPPSEVSNPHTASVNNTNANAHAGWGQDRSFYASQEESVFTSGNMDIKQSFPTELGKVSDQRAAWVATYIPAS